MADRRSAPLRINRVREPRMGHPPCQLIELVATLTGPYVGSGIGGSSGVSGSAPLYFNSIGAGCRGIQMEDAHWASGCRIPVGSGIGSPGGCPSYCYLFIVREGPSGPGVGPSGRADPLLPLLAARGAARLLVFTTVYEGEGAPTEGAGNRSCQTSESPSDPPIFCA